jgi:hypothetical protein
MLRKANRFNGFGRNLQSVCTRKSEVFIDISSFPMMFLLILNVPPNIFDIRVTDRVMECDMRITF